MATKTKTQRTKRNGKGNLYNPKTDIHDNIRLRYGTNVWYLQRVFREKPIGRHGSETVVLTQVWRREVNLMVMEQWEHHPEQTGRDPFKHQGEWVYMDHTEARRVWNEFVSEGAVQIN
jgi:hypothetical protein